jgi:hypothetical protein
MTLQQLLFEMFWTTQMTNKNGQEEKKEVAKSLLNLHWFKRSMLMSAGEELSLAPAPNTL